ncbi:hypothetical protein HDU92_001383 [Lobulomyces angularis]|nr:hypothetical protein HDU92_001383 [Lobulomyces angularis]
MVFSNKNQLLLTKGFPKLGRSLISNSESSYNTSFGGIKISLEIIRSEFNILLEYSINNLMNIKKSSSRYIKWWRFRSLEFRKTKINISHEQDLSSSIKNLISDIIVFRSSDNDIIDICEVKKPSKEGGYLDNYYLYCQIDCYMQELRYTYGVKYVYGIISTYNEWRICWYTNSQKISILNNVDDLIKYVKNDKDSYPYTIEDNKLYVSRVYKHDDPLTIQALISCLHKMYMTYIETPKFLNNIKFKFKYIESDQNRTSWKFLPNIDYFTYKYQQNYQNIYILSRIIMEVETVGYAPTKNTESKSEENFTDESNNWNMLWNCKTYIIKVINITKIVMPFAFHCIKDDNGKLYFKSPRCWNDKNNVEEGFKHDDIEWRHVSLLPIKKLNGKWGLKPIMIDLTRIEKVANTETINI